MTHVSPSPGLQSEHRQALRDAHRQSETACIGGLLERAHMPADLNAAISKRAQDLIEGVRGARKNPLGLDAFLQEFELSTPEGVALMCLAEALLRIPDAATQDALIRDKIVPANWERHLGHGPSVFVNASTWALMLTGRFLDHGELDRGEGGANQAGWAQVLDLAARAGDTVVREAIGAAMKVMGRQFVLGRTMEDALERAQTLEEKGFTYTYDILGEAAMTADQARHHFEGYVDAIKRLRVEASTRDLHQKPEVSVKLSALHPRYEQAQIERVHTELIPRVIDLARLASDADIGLTIDAEEAERLELSLDVLDHVSRDHRLRGWSGLGLAVQAYQKRAYAQIGWLEELARRDKRRLNIRLVKGAYWDREIKRAQVLGLDGYPVFTRKASTDVSYLACARRLLGARDMFFTAFASHNAHTIAAVIELAGEDGRGDIEFQKLHGMGDELYDLVSGPNGWGWPCRIYAPVGEHEELLPYLVRRLLENGANTSFVNRIADADTPAAELAADPVETVRALQIKPHPRIVLPGELFGRERRNSHGFDLDDPTELETLSADIANAACEPWSGGALIGGTLMDGGTRQDIRSPFDRSRIVGTVRTATAEMACEAFERAAAAQPAWAGETAAHRAACLERAADLYEEHTAELMALCIFEGGKTLDDAVAEIREAVDFLRYYAHRARLEFAHAEHNPGPTGERNETRLVGRGVFACISPWNFPLAIFTGQVAAALVAGNAVIAKPAGPTPLIATWAVQLLHQAGAPGDVLHVLAGPSGELGPVLTGHEALGGVAFTGSVETAHALNRQLADRPGPIVPLIAETGGQNAMIADSSALPEQVARDVLMSAFHSAGQRCSALRVLFVQADVADKMIDMVLGAMAELRVGDPGLRATDIGPLIDGGAVDVMRAHADKMSKAGTLLGQTPVDESLLERGSFFPPTAFEIGHIDHIGGEVFGPILHVIRYGADKLDAVIDAINATGFGLTLGIHSRIETTVEHIRARVRVGNTYVNRSQIGAVVGVQPFGGEGLSGTGPKAGGPRYLYRFATERTLSVDTTASGGNATLMSLEGD